MLLGPHVAAWSICSEADLECFRAATSSGPSSFDMAVLYKWKGLGRAIKRRATMLQDPHPCNVCLPVPYGYSIQYSQVPIVSSVFVLHAGPRGIVRGRSLSFPRLVHSLTDRLIVWQFYFPRHRLSFRSDCSMNTSILNLICLLGFIETCRWACYPHWVGRCSRPWLCRWCSRRAVVFFWATSRPRCFALRNLWGLRRIRISETLQVH